MKKGRPAEKGAAEGKGTEPDGPVYPTVDYPQFEFDKYVSKYRGYGRVTRLLWIAHCCPQFQVRAYQQAISELKRTLAFQLYIETALEARSALGDAIGADYFADQNWAVATQKRLAEALARAEAQVNTAVKDSAQDRMREAYRSMGQLLIEGGDFTGAIAKLLEARDRAATHQESLEASLAIIKAGILSSNWVQVKNQVDRATMILQNDGSRQPENEAIVQAALGWYELRRGVFGNACEAFLKVKVPLPEHFSEILVSEDIATFGTLCALSYLDRPSLKRRVLDNDVYRKFLDTRPVIRAIAQHFYACEYSECFKLLASIEKDLLLDFPISVQVPKLFKRIRDKAMVQYFSPYVAVQMSKMAAAFNLDVPTLEKELVGLIADNRISGRIDSHNKVLHAKHADQRFATFEKALRVGADYVRDVRSMLLRMSLIKHGFSIKQPRDRGPIKDNM